jgi:hypothetical protein
VADSRIINERGTRKGIASSPTDLKVTEVACSGKKEKEFKEKYSVIKPKLNMGYEELIVTTPLKHEVKVRLKQVGEDVWDTSLFYDDQVRRVGRFQGKRFAMEAATKKAIETADPPSSTSFISCSDDDLTCKTVSTIPQTPILNVAKSKSKSKTKTIAPTKLALRTSAKSKK